MTESSPKIQVISDLHLEHRNNIMKKKRTKIESVYDYILGYHKKSASDYLVICGDIGYPDLEIYRDFLKYVSTRYNKVFIVAGNHEYYKHLSEDKMSVVNHNVDQIESQIQQIVDGFDNIIYLNRSVYLDADTGLLFVGCVLWSHIPEDKAEIASKYLNDYRCITLDGRPLTVEDYNRLHERDINWLQSVITEKHEILTDRAWKIFVVTHHLPTSLLSHKKYESYSDLNCCFYTDLPTSLFDKIDYWVCGHTHMHMSAEIGKCKLFVNPLGYPNETKNGFKRLLIEP